MNIIWVATTGNDITGNGSQDTPYATIEKAVTVFISGDEIRILDGTYTPTDSIIVSGKSGSIFSENPGAVTIQPQKTTVSSAGVVILQADRFTLQGFHVTQATEATGNLIGIYVDDVDKFICYTCSVSDFDTPSGSGDCYGIYASNLRASLGRIDNCRVYDMNKSGDSLTGIKAINTNVVDCEVQRLYGTGDCTVIGIDEERVEDPVPPIPPVPPPGPVLGNDLFAYYAFENTAILGEDSTPNNIDLIDVVLAFPEPLGKVDACVKFFESELQWIKDTAPTNAYFNCANISISSWVYTNKTFGRGQGVINKGYYTFSDLQWTLQSVNYGDKWCFGVQVSDQSNQFVYSTSSLINTDWVHLVGTYDGTSLKIYVNGILEDTNSAHVGGDIHIYPAIDVRIGDCYTPWWTPQPFNGLIDEVGIWSRALTQPEVTQLYNGGVGLSYAQIIAL